MPTWCWAASCPTSFLTSLAPPRTSPWTQPAHGEAAAGVPGPLHEAAVPRCCVSKRPLLTLRPPHTPLPRVLGSAAMEAVAAQVNAHGGAAGQPPKSVDEVAMGFIRVANETMCRPIRALTQMKARAGAGAGAWAAEQRVGTAASARCCLPSARLPLTLRPPLHSCLLAPLARRATTSRSTCWRALAARAGSTRARSRRRSACAPSLCTAMQASLARWALGWQRWCRRRRCGRAGGLAGRLQMLRGQGPVLLQRAALLRRRRRSNPALPAHSPAALRRSRRQRC